jgi:molybdenum cofactor guanylyltransferase
MPDACYPREQITAAIIAGGKGRRMGNQDKGLVEMNGRPMISYIIERLQNQVGQMIINANRHLDTYAKFGYPLIRDHQEGYLGPLAGIESALLATKTRYLLCVPCDAPLIPETLGVHLYTAMQTKQAGLAVAHDGIRIQPMYALYRHDLLPDLQVFLAQQKRKVMDWINSQHYACADFSDVPSGFANANTAEERLHLALRLKRIIVCSEGFSPSNVGNLTTNN